MKFILVVFSFFVSASLNAQESGSTFCSVDISVNDSNKYQMLMWTVAGKNIVYRGHVDNLLTLAQAKINCRQLVRDIFPKKPTANVIWKSN